MHRLRSLAFSFLLACALASALPAQTGTAAKSAKTAPHASAPPAAAVVDINSASLSELKSVPGIGDAYAAKIIAGRPYKTKAQLKSRKILPAAVYDKASPSLIAKQK